MPLTLTDIKAAPPFAVDGWTVITDRQGFLAIEKELAPGSMPLAKVPEHSTETTRKLLALSAGPLKIELKPLREFIEQQCALTPGLARCFVLWCAVDAWLVKKWLDAIPFTECFIGCAQIRMAEHEQGNALVLEGDKWKIVIAGICAKPEAMANAARFGVAA